MEELLTKLGIDWRLLLAQLVNFLILFFILKKLLYRPVLDILKKREERIADGLESAKRSEERLAGIEIERAQVLQRAEAERSAMLERAAGEADALKRERVAVAEREAHVLVERAASEAARARAALMAEVRREVGDLVYAVSKKVTVDTLTKDDHDELVRRATDELREANV